MRRAPDAIPSALGELRTILGLGRQVWRLVPRRHKFALTCAAVLLAVVSACYTAFPLLLGRLVDGVQTGLVDRAPDAEILRRAGTILALIAVVYLAREGINIGRRYLVERACTSLEKALTVRVVAHLLKIDLAVLTHEKLGAIQGRIGRSVIGFVHLIRLGFLDFFPPLLTGAFALIAALTRQPWVALTMCGVVPLSVWLTARQMASQKGIRLELLRSRENLEGTLVELLSGLDFVRAAHTHQLEVGRVARVAEERRARELRHHLQMSLFGCAKAINEGFFHILVLALAIFLAVHERISYGDILMFSILFLNVMAPLNEIHRGLDEGHECSLQVADLLDMLNEPADSSFAAATVPALTPGGPVLRTERLTVEYTTTDGQRRRALDEVTLEVRHGETIGLVGRTGCGKTTLLRALLRLTHPTCGWAWIGGVPLAEVSRAALGRLIGYVGQSPFIFAGTIAENIAYGAPGATPEAIRDAAVRACLHHEIEAMPGGFDALVAERGLNLSGGQRQRLALARVFLKGPPVLILDEGTSALDNISERHVQHAIDLARRDRTVILVAHRLSTLLDADRILVFEDGRIVEEGTYAELLQRGGVFAEMALCAKGEPDAVAVP